MSNNVNHPKHYQGKNGIETIEIIRHYVCDIANALKYLMRAGKKKEMGMDDAEKEIEDLKKALWYIEDYEKNFCSHGMAAVCLRRPLYEQGFKELTGHTIDDVCKVYTKPVKVALDNLLRIGLIHYGAIAVYPGSSLTNAKKGIQQRILDIECNLLNNEIEATKTVMKGYAVDGEDYVSKPGCVRETEPEHYDPLNMIVAWGRVYSLTDEVRKKPNGALYSPCDNCDLIEVCYDDWRHPDTSVCHDFCRLHQAKTNEYYREVGMAKYAPSSGTVEVVDEHKEMQLELKRLDEEDDKI